MRRYFLSFFATDFACFTPSSFGITTPIKRVVVGERERAERMQQYYEQSTGTAKNGVFSARDFAKPSYYYTF